MLKHKPNAGKYNLQSGLIFSGYGFRSPEFVPESRCILTVSGVWCPVLAALRVGGVVHADLRSSYQISFWVGRAGQGEVERAWRVRCVR